MKVEKLKLKAKIFLQGNIMVRGFVHINQGERLQDFVNDSREDFIAVTNADLSSTGENNLEPLHTINKGDIILNKASIILIEEA